MSSTLSVNLPPIPNNIESDTRFLYSLFLNATVANKFNTVVSSLGTIVLSLIAVLTIEFKLFIDVLNEFNELFKLFITVALSSSELVNLVINAS